MLSRRRFLATSSILTAASTGLCRPSASWSGETIAPTSSPDQVAASYVARRRSNLRAKDPRIFLGYPANMNPPATGFEDWRIELKSVEIGQRSSNNVGDPFYDRGTFGAHMLEADLIERFARRYRFADGGAWGFVSNSGTDSNMHGAYIGRTLLHERTGVMPRFYYTTEGHYSIQIIGDLLGLKAVRVDANPDGSMNTTDLGEKLAANKEAPALVIATLGTTFKGAIDDIDAIQQQLKGFDSYLHLDAALFGGYIHVTDYLAQFAQQGPAGERYDSIAISCHKFFGYPGVAGLFIVGTAQFEEFRGFFSRVHDPAYISHVPGTITCSRDHVRAAECHYYCTAPSIAQQKEDAKMILSNAAYLQGELMSHFPDLNPSRFDERSNTIYFDHRFDEKLKKKWMLATIHPTADHPKALAHVVVMPHASRELLDDFLTDLNQYRR
jgi:histidine decarboxylase